MMKKMNFGIQLDVNFALHKMNTYPAHEYPNLYNEILKDYHHRWGKFSPIPYPRLTTTEDNPTPLLPKPIRKLPHE